MFEKRFAWAIGLFAAAVLAIGGSAACGDDGGAGGAGGSGGSAGSGGSSGCDPEVDPCAPGCAIDCSVCPQDPSCVSCDEAGVPACARAADCPTDNPAGYGCVDHCCIKLCGSASDCADRPDCQANPLGCVCEEGFCKTKVCSADAECGGTSACVDGACVDRPDASTATSCQVTPRYAVVHQGATLQLHPKAYDDSGKPLNLVSGFTYVSDTTASATVDADGLVTGGGTSGSAKISVTVGRASCEARVNNYAAVAGADLRVVVVDELTGLPVAGATIQVEGAAGPGDTDAGGAATFTGLAAGPKTVSVFHTDFSYVTVVGTGRNDLLVQLRRSIPVNSSGGFKGRFGPAEFFEDTNVHAGVAGTSIPGNLVDLSFEILVGPMRPTVINIGGERTIDLPSGVAIGLGSQWFKEEYQALGVPGVCASEAKSSAGTCGTRTAWGVAGGVPISKLPIDQLAGGGTDINVGQLLATLLPLFKDFKSAVERDVEFDVVPNTGEGIPDFARFTDVNLEAEHDLALRGVVNIPNLPQYQGVYTGAAIVLGGVNTRGRGVVPLGLTAGVDATDEGETPDGVVNALPDSGVDPGQVELRMAPAHSGLEGNPYGVIALALNITGFGGTSTCTAADRSGCTALAGTVKLFDSFPYDTEVSFADGFIGFAENATYAAASRVFALNGAVSGASIYRLNMKRDDGTEWNVFYSDGNASFTLPTPPAAVADRSLDSDASPATLSVQAMKSGVNLDALVDFDETNFENLVDVVTAFSTVDLPE